MTCHALWGRLFPALVLALVVPPWAVAAEPGAGPAAQSGGPGAWRQDKTAPRVAPPTDFRGIPFGAALEDVPGLIPVSEKIRDRKGRYKDVYFLKDEPLTYASADILSVAYTFREGKLYQVSMAVRGEANLFMIQDALIAHFGPGRQVGARYGWTWPDFSLVVAPESGDGVGGVIFTKER